MIACIFRDGLATYPVVTGTKAWKASLSWAQFHGIDPNTIPAGSTVVRDEQGRRIIYERFVYAPGTFPDPAGIMLTEDRTDAMHETVVEQGEASPLPLPREVTG